MKMNIVETLTLVRHGFSEANFLQGQHDKKDKVVGVPDEFFDRHDSNMRLTNLGVSQAVSAGEWLKANYPNFDKFYVSPHNRALETAHHMQLGGSWRIDDRFRERDWGLLQSVTRDGKDPLTEEMKAVKARAPWYWQPPGGESLASDVRLRMMSVMDTLYRKGDSKHSAIAVSHEEFLQTAQFVIEKLTPNSFRDRLNNPAMKLRNGMILQYSAADPTTGKRDHSYKWRRAICPWDESLSWDGGEWVRFETQRYSDDELASVYDSHDKFFPALTL